MLTVELFISYNTASERCVLVIFVSILNLTAIDQFILSTSLVGIRSAFVTIRLFLSLDVDRLAGTLRFPNRLGIALECIL